MYYYNLIQIDVLHRFHITICEFLLRIIKFRKVGITMSNITKRLPEAELEIMQIVWDADGNEEVITSNYIYQRFSELRGWALPTLMTVLTRLVRKGYLTCEKKGRSNYYGAKILRDEYIKYEANSSYVKTFCSNIDLLNKALIESGSVSKEDIVAAANRL